MNDFPCIRYILQQLQQSCHLRFFLYQQITHRVNARPLQAVFLSGFQVLQQCDRRYPFLLISGIVFLRPSGNQFAGGGKVQQAEESLIGLLSFPLPVRFLLFHHAFLLPTVMDNMDYQDKKGYPYQVSDDNFQFQSCLYHRMFVL